MAWKPTAKTILAEFSEYTGTNSELSKIGFQRFIIKKHGIRAAMKTKELINKNKQLNYLVDTIIADYIISGIQKGEIKSQVGIYLLNKYHDKEQEQEYPEITMRLIPNE